MATKENIPNLISNFEEFKLTSSLETFGNSNERVHMAVASKAKYIKKRRQHNWC